MNTHAHKVFLITGVSSGLGLAFAQAALAAGHTVVGTVRREAVDVATLKETVQVPVGKAPVQVGFAPDGRLALVSLSAANQLGIIDTARRKVIGTVDVGRTPIQMMATGDGRQVYVANQGSAQNPDDRVSIVDPQTRSRIGTVTTGKGAHGVAISTDGRYVFVSNIEAGTVSVIDTDSRKVVGTHKVGAGPNGISYKPPKAN